MGRLTSGLKSNTATGMACVRIEEWTDGDDVRRRAVFLRVASPKMTVTLNPCTQQTQTTDNTRVHVLVHTYTRSFTAVHQDPPHAICDWHAARPATTLISPGERPAVLRPAQAANRTDRSNLGSARVPAEDERADGGAPAARGRGAVGGAAARAVGPRTKEVCATPRLPLLLLGRSSGKPEVAMTTAAF